MVSDQVCEFIVYHQSRREKKERLVERTFFRRPRNLALCGQLGP